MNSFARLSPVVTAVWTAASLFLTGAAMAEERRQLDSHEHGVTTLNIALEDRLLVMELEGPAMNFVGFEHEPRTDEQKAAIADAVAALEDGSTLFELTGAAECSLAETDVELETDDDDHSDHDHHSDHDDHDGDEQHSEFEAEYAFECDNAGKLAKIRVGLFDRFPLTTEVEVSYVGEGFQTFKSLTAADPVLTVEP